MPTAIENTFDVIETALEALTPPSRTEVTYSHVDGQNRNEGSSGDRTFWIDIPTELEVQGEAGIQLSQIGWKFAIRVRLNLDGYSVRDQAKAVARESVLLFRGINKIPEASLPNGAAVFATGVATERLKNSVIVSIAVDAWTEETD